MSAMMTEGSREMGGGSGYLHVLLLADGTLYLHNKGIRISDPKTALGERRTWAPEPGVLHARDFDAAIEGVTGVLGSEPGFVTFETHEDYHGPVDEDGLARLSTVVEANGQHIVFMDAEGELRTGFATGNLVTKGFQHWWMNELDQGEIIILDETELWNIRLRSFAPRAVSTKGWEEAPDK